MMFAARKLQGIGLLLLLTISIFLAYPIWLKVSSTRAELQQVREEIARVRQQNRMLEGDIAVLANVRQLDRWNTEFLGYVAPGSDQYLSGERALASLDGLRPPQGGAPVSPVLVAAAVAPAATVADDDDDSGGTTMAGPADRTRVAMVDRRSVTASTVDDIRRPIPIASADIGPAR